MTVLSDKIHTHTQLNPIATTAVGTIHFSHDDAVLKVCLGSGAKGYPGILLKPRRQLQAVTTMSSFCGWLKQSLVWQPARQGKCRRQSLHLLTSKLETECDDLQYTET